ncbi:hypothetical protein AWB81_06427 [Caballeronia arationis]|jgi:hypothetical protein|nr:hypothetical protein [Caballeronia arationis]SAL03479.1 hypothetical protein AWB81_06427 [Caballeronia arationis]
MGSFARSFGGAAGFILGCYAAYKVVQKAEQYFNRDKSAPAQQTQSTAS